MDTAKKKRQKIVAVVIVAAVVRRRVCVRCRAVLHRRARRTTVDWRAVVVAAPHAPARQRRPTPPPARRRRGPLVVACCTSYRRLVMTFIYYDHLLDADGSASSCCSCCSFCWRACWAGLELVNYSRLQLTRLQRSCKRPQTGDCYLQVAFESQPKIAVQLFVFCVKNVLVQPCHAQLCFRPISWQMDRQPNSACVAPPALSIHRNAWVVTLMSTSLPRISL